MTRLARVVLGIVLLIIAVYYVMLAYEAYARISPVRGVPLSRIVGYALLAASALFSSSRFLVGKARAASGTALLIIAANYTLYAYWAYVNNQKVFGRAPFSAIVLFVLVALSALVISYLVLKRGHSLRSIEVFLGIFLILSLLGYGLAELDRGIYPGSVVASVAETLGLSYLGNAGLRETLWHLRVPLFGIDVALRLLTSATLFAGHGIQRRTGLRIVHAAFGAAWSVYGSALLQWYLSGSGYAINLGLGPRSYFYYFLFPTASVAGALFVIIGGLLLSRALGSRRNVAEVRCTAKRPF